MQNKRIVVKIGTSTLAHPSGLLNIRQVESLCKVLSDLKNAGHELILVSSGAIGMGVGKALPLPPARGYAHQAGCRRGGPVRADVYLRQTFFPSMAMWWPRSCCRGTTFTTPSAPPTSRAPSSACWRLHALPILNENDAVSTEEIGEHTTIGENDTLAAQVAVTMGADLLVILSGHQRAVHRRPPHPPGGHPHHRDPSLTQEIWALAGGPAPSWAPGG